MRMLRAIACVVLLAVIAFFAYRFLGNRASPFGDSIAVYYTKIDGETLARWDVSLNPHARDEKSVAFYATAQAVAGPQTGIEAIRFPAGTIARSVHVAGSTATVDLGGNVASDGGGSFGESGEFKALVWTLTALPGIDAVQIEVDGARVPTLRGGHLELDEPLTRKSW